MYELVIESENNAIINRLNALLHEKKIEIIELVTFHHRSGCDFPKIAILIDIEPLSRNQSNKIAEFSLVCHNDPSKFVNELNTKRNSDFCWNLEKCCQSALFALFSRNMEGKLKEEAFRRRIEDTKEMQRIIQEEQAEIKDQVRNIQSFITSTMVEISKDIEEAVKKEKYSESIRLWFIKLENLSKFGVFIEFRHIEKNPIITEYLEELTKAWSINLQYSEIDKWKKIRNKIAHEYIKISKNEAEKGFILFSSVTKLLIGKINDFLKAPFEWKTKENPFISNEADENNDDNFEYYDDDCSDSDLDEY